MKESARLRGRRNGSCPLFGSSFNFCGLNFSIVDRRWHGRSMNIRTGRVPVPSKFWRFLFFFLFCFAPRERFFVSFGGREFGEWKKFCGSRKWKVVFLRACVLSFCINFVSGFFIHFYFKVWIHMYIYIVRPHQWINASDCRRELRIEFVFFFLSKSSNYIHLGSMRVDKSTASSNYKSRKTSSRFKIFLPEECET